MDGPDEHVTALVEDLLRAVAVVGVDVEDRDGPAEPACECRRRYGRVVEVTRAAVACPAYVMARWAAACVCAGRACSDEIHSRQCAVDSGARGVPGTGPDEGHRVVREVARPCPDGGRHCRPPSRRQRFVGEHVRHDAVLVPLSIEPCTGPFAPGRLEELQERRIVHGMQGHVGVLLGVDDTCTGFGERSEDHVSACDHLGAGRTYPRRRSRRPGRAAGSGRSKPPASRAPPSDLNANLASHGKVNRANQPQMGDESTRRSRRCSEQAQEGLDAAEPHCAREVSS